MNNCEHKTKHTQRLTDKQVPSLYVIVTWCADCGERLKIVDIK